MVRAAVHAVGVAAPERPVRLEAAGPVHVLGDPDRLRQVIDNLLANAVRHTPSDAPITVHVRRDEDSAYLDVADGGPGVPATEQAQIFEPFRRSDPTRARATGGAGLGLTIVSAIAHAHGGTVGVISPTSADDGAPGATFWVRLPLAAVGPSGAPGGAPGYQESEGGGAQTLAMDGEAGVAVHEGERVMPVGPLRCLAIMISALPRSAESGL